MWNKKVTSLFLCFLVSFVFKLFIMSPTILKKSNAVDLGAYCTHNAAWPMRDMT